LEATGAEPTKIIVPVSGGKDSQACLKLAIEQHGSDNVLGLFCDTQWEHPLTYTHVDNLSKLYKVEIKRITGGSVPEKVMKYKRFPVLGIRFCTDELKIRETKMFLDTYSKEHGACDVWYGMRSDESHARRERYKEIIDNDRYMPHEVLKKYPKYLGKQGVRFVLPILSWTTAEVFDYLAGEENPLYKMGFDRVGCFPCLAAGDKQKEKTFEFDDFGKEQRNKVIWLEQQTGKNVFTTKKYQAKYQEGAGCSICSI
jgi:3'-phosphoadenosine 5'-phosphosulfate sulfotransferase (PAPS reductase)/FAD synthetase